MAIGGMCVLLSRLVHILGMYGMVMDQTHHVFPGSGVDELLPVCQQEPFAVRHLGAAVRTAPIWGCGAAFIRFSAG